MGRFDFRADCLFYAGAARTAAAGAPYKELQVALLAVATQWEGLAKIPADRVVETVKVIAAAPPAASGLSYHPSPPGSRGAKF